MMMVVAVLRVMQVFVRLIYFDYLMDGWYGCVDRVMLG